MKLDESRFTSLAEDMLERIADAVDDALGDEVDAELVNGVLTLSLPGVGQYVINRHGPNRQIWLSSPISGAWHFDYADGDWISTREPRMVIEDLLAKELKARFGVAVDI